MPLQPSRTGQFANKELVSLATTTDHFGNKELISLVIRTDQFGKQELAIKNRSV